LARAAVQPHGQVEPAPALAGQLRDVADPHPIGGNGGRLAKQAAHLGYPRGLLALERGLRYNQRQKRTDLLALNPDGKPLLLVECKAPTVPITAATAHQATTYNQTIGAPLLLLTNGLVHYCWRVDFATRTNERLADIPAFAAAVQL